MTLRLRTDLLGLCGQIEALRNNLARYRERYTAKLENTNTQNAEAAERLRTIITGILEGIDNVMITVDRISNLLCDSDPSLASIMKAYYIADKTYYKIMIGQNMPIPASIRSAFYEIYRILKVLANQ